MVTEIQTTKIWKFQILATVWRYATPHIWVRTFPRKVTKIKTKIQDLGTNTNNQRTNQFLYPLENVRKLAFWPKKVTFCWVPFFKKGEGYFKKTFKKKKKRSRYLEKTLRKKKVRFYLYLTFFQNPAKTFHLDLFKKGQGFFPPYLLKGKVTFCVSLQTSAPNTITTNQQINTNEFDRSKLWKIDLSISLSWSVICKLQNYRQKNSVRTKTNYKFTTQSWSNTYCDCLHLGKTFCMWLTIAVDWFKHFFKI